MSQKIRREDALNYHEQGVPGKIEVVPTKLVTTQRDLALAYSPGVAEPCLEIDKDPDAVYRYTAKGNLVAVISNGTAVLGLGNIGPEASKPVMEGKGVLFKKFAGIDVFDIEVDAEDPERFIEVVKALEPTFGGVNLEDIKAPESFVIEERLKEEMNIPVMHDDQHGTAIISASALLNALELTGKKIEDIKIVVNGAGAAAISCTKLYVALGAKKENIVMLDSKGVIRKDREGLREPKSLFATEQDVHGLDDAMVGADVFLGLSVADVLSPEHLNSMAAKPIVFALANPNPEIAYDLAMATREDIIMATGRSDHPNQVNNVLGFPYIFRGALDVRATAINEAMKLAAVHALAELTKEPVPDHVAKAYEEERIEFGEKYLIPKPLDPRLITAISIAVAKAAIDSGVAKHPIADWGAYEGELKRRLGLDDKFMTVVMQQAKAAPKRVVFAEGDQERIIRAAQIVQEEGIGIPILLGNEQKIAGIISGLGLDFTPKVIDVTKCEEQCEHYAELLFAKRQRKGTTLFMARKYMNDRQYFGPMMVEVGDADAFIGGITRDYSSALGPVLSVIGKREDVSRVAGVYILKNKRGTFFFGDATVNEDPTAEELSDIAGSVANAVRFFGIEPRVALLSYSNFGSNRSNLPNKVIKATELARKKYTDMVLDGEVQANVALNTALLREQYPFSPLAKEGANTLVFPNLASGNIAYKLMMEMGGAEGIGPILVGMNKSAHILQMGSSVREVVNMAAIAVVDAQKNQEREN